VPQGDGSSEAKATTVGEQLDRFANDLKSAARKYAADEQRPGQFGQVFAKIRRDVKQLAAKLEHAVPVDCPRCGGKGCRSCEREGWMRRIDRDSYERSKGKGKRGAA
jgi:hypothetical protein